MSSPSLEAFLSQIAERNPGQPEYLQAVTEVLTSLWPFLAKNPKYTEQGLLERLVEPERILMFRVSWVDDQGRMIKSSFDLSGASTPMKMEAKMSKFNVPVDVAAPEKFTEMGG